MKSRSVVRVRADWVRIIEAALAAEPDDRAWGAEVLEAFGKILPGAAAMAIYAFEHDPSFTQVKTTIFSASAPGLIAEMERAGDALIGLGRDHFVPFHYPPTPVVTIAEIERTLPRAMADASAIARRRTGITDALGVVTHPAPGVVVVISAFLDQAAVLTSYERQLLTRIALHVENASRLRRQPENVKAELTIDGRLLHRDSDAPSVRLLEAHGKQVAEARSRKRRGSADAIELWSALVAGRTSLVARSTSKHSGYAVLENEPAARALRTLSAAESEVLRLAARGLSSKLISYALGVAPSAVSANLASAAAKIGVGTHAELVRIAALLAGDPYVDLPEAELSAAETEVLALLQRGLSNEQIARRRGRSIRTIANQVASLLAKTGSPTRRALLTRVERSPHQKK